MRDESSQGRDMAYLRLSSPTNDNWAARAARNPTPDTWAQRRYGVMPPRRRGNGGHLVLGLIAMPMGVCGLWLLLGAPTPTEPPAIPPIARPLVFQVPPPGLSIVVNREPPPSNHPETWGALPTAVAAPVVATPLADASPPEDMEGCRDAPSLAAQMTCIDPTLREAEQRMAAAYEAVLAVGISPAALGRSQARWLAARDAAAGTSPEDLLTTYQQRESQLRSFAVALERRAASVGIRDAKTSTPVILGLVPRIPVSAAKTSTGEATT
jgi:uncharacterized protein YecT (DUF1311 family)